jgi:glycosyltransferase involved in cell wall biosynthesis
MKVLLLIIFILVSLSQICYYLCIFYKFVRFNIKPEKQNHILPVSVIICAKDEAENLLHFLPSVYKQNHPDFEVILINDRSIDNTLEIMQKFKEKYPDKTRVVNVPVSNDNRLSGNKKYALTLGIKAAKNELLLFTDADCRPASDNWIHYMTKGFTGKKQIVLGYGKYRTESTFLNKLIRYETLLTAIQYFSYALNKIPYMGVGRNLAYTKKLFMKNNGFYNHLDILSGDDDLFINETATSENTNICLHPDSFTISIPKQNWRAYIHQKRRHISTARHYRPRFKFLLGFYHTGLIMFWFTAILLLSLQLYLPYVIGIIFVRFIITGWIQNQSAKKLQENNLILWFPVLEIVLILFQLYIFVRNLIQKPVYWKR